MDHHSEGKKTVITCHCLFVHFLFFCHVPYNLQEFIKCCFYFSVSSAGNIVDFFAELFVDFYFFPILEYENYPLGSEAAGSGYDTNEPSKFTIRIVNILP